MRRHLIRLASAPFTSFRLAKFGWVRFADLSEVKPNQTAKRKAPVCNETEYKIYEGLVKLRSYFKPFVDQTSWTFETM